MARILLTMILQPTTSGSKQIGFDESSSKKSYRIRLVNAEDKKMASYFIISFRANLIRPQNCQV